MTIVANGRDVLLDCAPSFASGVTLRLVLLALLALLACLLAVSAAFAGTPVALRVPGHAVQAGQRVRLEWSGLPADAREVELELSLDGGRWIRISPEMDAGESRWTWTVPNLPAESARIRLRCGRDHEEFVAATSAAFPITGSGPGPSGSKTMRANGGRPWRARQRPPRRVLARTCPNWRGSNTSPQPTCPPRRACASLPSRRWARCCGPRSVPLRSPCRRAAPARGSFHCATESRPRVECMSRGGAPPECGPRHPCHSMRRSACSPS